jgi:hypothetical protein
MKKAIYTAATIAVLGLTFASSSAFADDYVCTAATSCATIDLQHRVYTLPTETIVSTNSGIMLQRDTGWKPVNAATETKTPANSN